MKYLLLLLLVFTFFITDVSAQSISDARAYATLAIKKSQGTSNVRNISIQIEDWHYNRSTGQYYIYYSASYEWWSILFWDSSTNKIQLYCDLQGRNAKFKYDGFGNSWSYWDTVYPD